MQSRDLVVQSGEYLEILDLLLLIKTRLGGLGDPYAESQSNEQYTRRRRIGRMNECGRP